MNNKLEVIGIDHGWSMMKTISQVFVTGVKAVSYTHLDVYKRQTQEERGVRMSKKRYEIVSYDIPLWLKPVLSVTETSIYTGISANKIYEMRCV